MTADLSNSRVGVRFPRNRDRLSMANRCPLRLPAPHSPGRKIRSSEFEGSVFAAIWHRRALPTGIILRCTGGPSTGMMFDITRRTVDWDDLFRNSRAAQAGICVDVQRGTLM